ncbi:MFS transporter [Pectinatus frisingensis]|uniref:MFS transporter n=1 Tax=Pectinatus frisingensis TaxID=865 RepID=UPI0018C7100F|nr:MFS transporter [Pectinatus frisingensis]
MNSAKTLDDFELTPYLKKMILFSSGGPFIDGYVLVIIGIALTQIAPYMNMDAYQMALAGVAALAGTLFGAAIFGYLTDLIGRKFMFTFDIVAIAVISILCMFIDTAIQLIVLRFFIGIVIGADYPIATSLIVEFTPRSHRASAMGFITAAWFVGAVCADIAGYFLLETAEGWRYMLGSAVIPCIVLILGRWNTPESPRWLLSKNRIDEARTVVTNYFGADFILEPEIHEKIMYYELFKNKYFKKVIFIGVMWACQIAPMFILYTFGPQIIGAFGFDEEKSVVFGDIVISFFFLVGTILAMCCLDSIGRRPMIIGSYVGMTVSLGVLSVVQKSNIWIIVGAFACYAFFSGAPGILEWLYPNELFPTNIRASAVGVTMAFSRVGAIVSSYVLPIILTTHGIRVTMLAGTLITILGLSICITMAPETKDLKLSESCTAELKQQIKK